MRERDEPGFVNKNCFANKRNSLILCDKYTHEKDFHTFFIGFIHQHQRGILQEPRAMPGVFQSREEQQNKNLIKNSRQKCLLFVLFLLNIMFIMYIFNSKIPVAHRTGRSSGL